MGTIKIAVLGATGRMGRALIHIISEDPDLEVASAWVRPGDRRSGEAVASWHPAAADSGARTTERLTEALAGADVAIDFSLPGATVAILAAVERSQKPLVCGVTGLGAGEQEALAKAAARIPIVYDRNMSVGMQLMNYLVHETARRLGPDYDAEILEAHHRAKRDAPSGTALMLGETLAQARSQHLDEVAVYARHGDCGPREQGSIGFATIRAGAVVGEHSVIFASSHDRLTLSHQAQDRAAFAAGAVRAARWLCLEGRRPACYDMTDVLGLGADSL